jgi:hypothetical protein
MHGGETRTNVWRSDDPSVGILRLQMTAQARRKAEVIGGSEGDEAIRSFVLQEIDEQPRFVARPSSVGQTTYLILGKQCVLITTLSEGLRSQISTRPPALRVVDIAEVDTTVIEKLSLIAYRPDRAYFDLRICVRPDDHQFTEYVYFLTTSVDWFQFGGRISSGVMEILNEGSSRPSDALGD